MRKIIYECNSCKKQFTEREVIGIDMGDNTFTISTIPNQYADHFCKICTIIKIELIKTKVIKHL